MTCSRMSGRVRFSSGDDGTTVTSVRVPCICPIAHVCGGGVVVSSSSSFDSEGGCGCGFGCDEKHTPTQNCELVRRTRFW